MMLDILHTYRDRIREIREQVDMKLHPERYFYPDVSDMRQMVEFPVFKVEKFEGKQ